ncbi:MAG: NAD(P)-dependent oxidoreductase, partial [Bacteroidetes bacterium]|nr:NAD(P)-dependent oxidoreductase [Bacteroidota bacterium]
GAGFIGSRLVRMLSENGFQVVVIDNLTSNLPFVQLPNVVNYNLDVRDATALDEIIGTHKPYCIVHLAAIHHVPTCEIERNYALDVNVIGTENLLLCMEKYQVSKLVFASTGAVYSPDFPILNEDETPVDPFDNYSLSKFTNEKQIRFYQQRTEADVCIARLFNTIGANDPNAHLIPDILRQIDPEESNAIVKLGNIKSRRDYIHVEDTANLLMLMATSAPKKGLKVYNVCTSVEYSVEEIVEKIGVLMNKPISIEIDPEKIRKYDRISQIGNNQKVLTEFNTQLFFTIEDALKDILAKMYDFQT